MTDLHELLELATDRVEATGLAPGALVAAGRRRRNRRALVAGTAAVAAVVTVVMTVRVSGEDHAAREVPPASEAPSVPAAARWYPHDLDHLQVATVPGLPKRLDVPDIAPHVEDDPVDAAVLSIDDGADVLLLGTDGRWRCVVVPDRSGAEPVLSLDGTQLAVPVTDGVITVDLATGNQTEGRFRSSPDPDWDSPRLVPAARAWSVRPVAGFDDGSVLLRVVPPVHDGHGWWLLKWDPVTYSVGRVTKVDSDPAKRASFASDLLAGR